MAGFREELNQLAHASLDSHKQVGIAGGVVKSKRCCCWCCCGGGRVGGRGGGLC
jgi:hypothetical protein